MDQTEYLTTKEAAQYLGVTPARVRQFISEGRLKSKKQGRDHLIAEEDIKQFSDLPRERTGRPTKKKSFF